MKWKYLFYVLSGFLIIAGCTSTRWSVGDPRQAQAVGIPTIDASAIIGIGVKK